MTVRMLDYMMKRIKGNCIRCARLHGYLKLLQRYDIFNISLWICIFTRNYFLRLSLFTLCFFFLRSFFTCLWKCLRFIQVIRQRLKEVLVKKHFISKVFVLDTFGRRLTRWIIYISNSKLYVKYVNSKFKQVLKNYNATCDLNIFE